MNSKISVPIITPVESGSTNSNYSGEIAKIMALVSDTARSNTGQVQWTSPTSGIVYDTSAYSSNTDIYNQGNTGLYNLLIYLYGGNDGWILTATDYNTLMTSIQDTTSSVTGILAGTTSVGNATTATTATTATNATNANNATQLKTARSLVSNLATTTPASFNGTADVSIGVTGILPEANGGTGVNALSSASVGSASQLVTSRTLVTNLATTTVANFNGTANASIGVTGVLPVANGGTGASTLDNISVGTAITATKLGSTTIGSTVKPIYLNSGVATALSNTVGSSTTPAYLNAGAISVCSRAIPKVFYGSTTPTGMVAGDIWIYY